MTTTEAPLPASLNGNTVTFKWLVSILMVIVIALVGAWGRDLTAQVASLAAQVGTQSARIGNIDGQLTSNSERLKRIETNQDLMLQRLPVPRSGGR